MQLQQCVDCQSSSMLGTVSLFSAVTPGPLQDVSGCDAYVGDVGVGALAPLKALHSLNLAHCERWVVFLSGAEGLPALPESPRHTHHHSTISHHINIRCPLEPGSWG